MSEFDNYIELFNNWKIISDTKKKTCCNFIIETSQARELSMEEIELIANGLAKSGSAWKWPNDVQPITDVCSTGGSGSMTTLLCPYLIATQKIKIPQVSVLGSIAGAIDTLGIIPDYSYQLSHKAMLKALRTAGIGHTLNTPDMAPADLFLFNQRKAQNAVNLPDLVISSLLAKKISSGLTKVLFDVRVGPVGNFGTTIEEAEQNCRKLIQVGRNIGIDCTCVLTNHDTAPIPLFGRLESLNVLWSVANGIDLDAWTLSHIETNIDIAAIACESIKGGSIRGWTESIRKSILNGDVFDLIRYNLNSQGSSIESLEMLITKYNKTKKYAIYSPSDGYINRFDFVNLRNIFQQAYFESPIISGFDSPLGIILKVREGVEVHKGDLIMELRVNNKELLKHTEELKKVVLIDKKAKSPPQKKIFKVIKNG